MKPFERLQSLRLPVVTIDDISSRAYPDLSREALHVHLNKLQKAGYIEKAGPRSGVYYNRTVLPKGRRLREAAVERLLRDLDIKQKPVLVGTMCVHHTGWIDQAPEQITIAIPALRATRSIPKIDDVSYTRRPMSWFRSVEVLKGRQRVDSGEGVIAALTPEFSVADYWIYEDGTLMGPDIDLTEDEMSRDPQEIIQALERAVDKLGGKSSARENLRQIKDEYLSSNLAP